MATVRLSVNLNEASAQALKEIAEKNDMTITETVRRMVSLYKYVEDEVVDRGRSLQVCDPREAKTFDLPLGVG